MRLARSRSDYLSGDSVRSWADRGSPAKVCGSLQGGPPLTEALRRRLVSSQTDLGYAVSPSTRLRQASAPRTGTVFVSGMVSGNSNPVGRAIRLRRYSLPTAPDRGDWAHGPGGVARCNLALWLELPAQHGMHPETPDLALSGGARRQGSATEQSSNAGQVEVPEDRQMDHDAHDAVAFEPPDEARDHGRRGLCCVAIAPGR